MTASSETETRRKRLLWRATHRGIKEMDLILGGFVVRHIDTFSDAEIADLERIMDIQPDTLHQRVSVILGSRNEVERVTQYHLEADAAASKA